MTNINGSGAVSANGWIFRSGAAHSFIGIALLFLTMHPLRDALEAAPLELIKIMSAVQALNGIALLALWPRLAGKLAPALIAGGVAASALMIWIIAFTGMHPFDLMVPLGGLAMMIGWLLLLLGKGVE